MYFSKAYNQLCKTAYGLLRMLVCMYVCSYVVMLACNHNVSLYTRLYSCM